MKPWVRHAVVLVVMIGVGLAVGRRWLGRERFEPPAPLPNAAHALNPVREAATRIDAALETARTGKGGAGWVQADELAVLRRLTLALAGTVPSVEEIRAFERHEVSGHSREERIQWWLSHLFRDRRHADYLAERFARAWVGVEDGPFVVYRRHRLVSWIADELGRNRRYDALVRELITAEGIWTSRPQVNFVTVTVDQNNDKEGPDEQKLAGRVARAFLGVRLDCVQCHDDFLGDRWKQKDFHQLAAFFACAEMSMTGVRDDPKKQYEHRYLRRPEAEVVAPKVPFAGELLPDEGPLRARLAAWVTHRENRAFARALVNRTWALLFNRPLQGTVDDIPTAGPWHPAMEALADEAIASDFDLQRLIRVIVATRAFQADSRAGEPDPAKIENSDRDWATFPLTRLRPEQVAGAILQSANLRTIDAESAVMVRVIRHFQLKDFVRRYGDLGQDEFEEVGGTLPQRLVLMNGELVKERTKEDLVMNAATRIAAVSPDASTSLETAYLAVLTRRPTPEERDYFLAKWKEDPEGKGSGRVEDLYWTLINSTEFSWNH